MKADGGGRHAVAGVGVEIVGAEAGPHQLGRGIALEDRPLARAEHADGGRPFSFSTRFALLGHHVERLVPETGSNSPSLSYAPFFLRISGVVSRSSPYMILDRK